MEIRKIFSDLYDEERLYSVLMNEDEMMMFSEIQKEFGNAANKALKNAWVNKVGGRDQLKRLNSMYAGLNPETGRVATGMTSVGNNLNTRINARAINGNLATRGRITEGTVAQEIIPKSSIKNYRGYNH